MIRENTLYLAGELTELPAFSHACYDQSFCRFFLSVERKSGTADVLPVLAEEGLLPPMMALGEKLSVEGQLRAYSQRVENGSRLMIAAFAQAIHLVDGEPENAVTLTGRVARPPVYRSTPLGREITDLFLEVPRGFRKSDFLPVIAWGRSARDASQCVLGETVSITGRLQSRKYTKMLPDGTSSERTAYEVSAFSFMRVPQTDDAYGTDFYVHSAGTVPYRTAFPTVDAP